MNWSSEQFESQAPKFLLNNGKMTDGLLEKLFIGFRRKISEVGIKATQMVAWLVGWFTPLLLWDGGTSQTKIQVDAVNLTELAEGGSGSPSRTSHGCKLQTGRMVVVAYERHSA